MFHLRQRAPLAAQIIMVFNDKLDFRRSGKTVAHAIGEIRK